MPFRLAWFVLACFILVSAKASKNSIKSKLRSNQNHDNNVLSRMASQADLGTKRSEQGGIAGTFKINDGGVVGAGVYEVGKDGKVDIDLKIRITPSGSGEGGGSNPTQPPGGHSGGTDEQIALSIHNNFRKVHNSPPMTLNAEMSKAAKEYAEKLAKMGALQHASKGERDGAGENLSFGCSSDKGQTPEEAVTNWYNEVCDPGYSFGGDSGRSGTGHFTQVVWRGSTELGFGSATGEMRGMKCTYYVGRYKAAGNMMGQYNSNVEKGSLDQESYCSNLKSKF
ncbi:probable pathogenesis-related protein CaO19.2336 [Nematostella vectensis]|uniref:probable pathogenesis-related protein CaO19.2336 n=1 Tax=Nematostella vectensis TaxID=45351 RepID=UPI00207700F7|nr:probable pathogenesis-related protein CaO19.2336 [Nematostella vectensis]